MIYLVGFLPGREANDAKTEWTMVEMATSPVGRMAQARRAKSVCPPPLRTNGRPLVPPAKFSKKAGALWPDDT